MAVTVFQTEAHATGTTASNTTTVTKPTDTADGDLLIVGIAGQLSSETISSVPAGWSSVTSNVSGSPEIYVYSKIASSEGASWNWGWTGSQTHCWIALRFSNVDSSTPINTSATSDLVANDDTPSWANTITPTVPELMHVAFMTSFNGGTYQSDFAIATSSPTWTTRANAATDKLIAVTGSRPQTTATGNSSASFSTTGDTMESKCAILAINRDLAVTATVTPDTVTVSDSMTAPADFHLSASDSVSVSDTLAASDEIQWSYGTKSATSWTNTNK